MKSSSESSTNPITVVIADDHPVVRKGLVAIFEPQTDIKVVAEATNGEDSLEMCNQHLPDVLLLDLRMPRKDGLQVMTELAARTISGPRVIVMTTYDSEDDIRRSVKTGAKGYLVKGIAPQQIRESVRRVAAGESVLSSKIATKLAESIARPQLSKRERQVLKYLANGRSNKEITQILYLSEHTAKAHVKSIMEIASSKWGKRRYMVMDPVRTGNQTSKSGSGQPSVTPRQFLCSTIEGSSQFWFL